jgi:hypothetical protein
MYGAPAAPGYRQNVFVPPGTVAGPLVAPWLRTLKLGLGVLQLLAMFIGFGGLIAGAVTADSSDGPNNVFLLVGGLSLGFWYFALFAYAIANMVWIYKFWSWLPPEQRYTNLWKKYISPGTAIGFMFIPYFNIYWLFVVYLGLADIMERMRVQYPTQKGSAKTLAILTAVVPIVFFPAGPFLQFFFAKHLEEMATEMNARRMGMGAMG